jgi:hypothetical protein
LYHFVTGAFAEFYFYPSRQAKFQGETETSLRLIYLGLQLTTRLESDNALHMQQEILFGEIGQLFFLPTLSHLLLNSKMETLK